MLNKLFTKKNAHIHDKLVLDSDACIGSEGILTQSFGIRISDGSIAPFSRKGEPYPNRGSYTFSTDEDFQDQITLEFHRSTHLMATADSLVGQVMIVGYKPEKAGVPLLRVYYELSDNQIVIWVTDERSSKNNLSLLCVKSDEVLNVH
jgi:molecular chaperone DnaK (HSP70)